MSAGVWNFTKTEEFGNNAVEQGATWSQGLFYGSDSVTPVPMAGWSARMQIRRSVGSPVLVELSTANGRIVLHASNGSVSLLLSAAVTAALNFTTAIYDIELTNAAGTVVIRWLKGDVELSKEVTV